ncbi:hypothetical protein FRC08_000992 [Ceratobasidium sp. 394]|nr:hypothetical protein FRC08_000992 [Ceratobasidium sp. 394]
MMEDFWSGVKSGMAGACTELSRKALEFIVSHGGATSRWQSVSIATDLLGPHLAVAEFLRSSSLPELRYLELTSHAPAHFTGLDMMALRTAMNTEPLPLFQDPPSKLCTVKIGGLPNPLLFGHSNQLHLPNLTHLELSFVGSPPKLSDLVALFQATPQLVVLHLDYDLEVFPLSTDPNPQAPKIRLIQLREFALINHVWNASWPLSFLTRLEAPNVDLLHIRLVECDGSSGAFVECLADGGDKATPRPIFPSVTRLKIMPRPGDATPLLKTLLRAHPRITLLEIPSIPLDALLVEPWLAPNLQHLFVEGRPGSELKKVVDARAEAKLPLKAVYSDPSSGTLINPADREYLSSKVEFKFVQLREGYRVVRDVPSG